jgi:hypothetical protein
MMQNTSFLNIPFVGHAVFTDQKKVFLQVVRQFMEGR